MKDQGIRNRRTELEKERVEIVEGWKQNDKQRLESADHPREFVHQSQGFHARDRQFFERLKAVDKQLYELSRSSVEKMRLIKVWAVLIAILLGTGCVIWRYLL